MEKFNNLIKFNYILQPVSKQDLTNSLLLSILKPLLYFFLVGNSEVKEISGQDIFLEKITDFRGGPGVVLR